MVRDRVSEALDKMGPQRVTCYQEPVWVSWLDYPTPFFWDLQTGHPLDGPVRLVPQSKVAQGGLGPSQVL